MTSMDINRERF